MTASVAEYLVSFAATTPPVNLAERPTAVDGLDEEFDDELGEALSQILVTELSTGFTQIATANERNPELVDSDETDGNGVLTERIQKSDQNLDRHDNGFVFTKLMADTESHGHSNADIHRIGGSSDKTVPTEDVHFHLPTASTDATAIRGHRLTPPTTTSVQSGTIRYAPENSIAPVTDEDGTAQLPHPGADPARGPQVEIQPHVETSRPTLTVDHGLVRAVTGGASDNLAAAAQRDSIVHNGQQLSRNTATPTISLNVETRVDSQPPGEAADFNMSNKSKEGGETIESVLRHLRSNAPEPYDAQRPTSGGRESNFDRTAFVGTGPPVTAALAQLVHSPTATAAHVQANVPVTGQVAGAVAQELLVQWEPGEQVRAISLQLDPPELGALRINVRLTPDGLQLQVAAAEDVTLEMLNTRVPEIELFLRHQELNVHRVTIQRLEFDAGGSPPFDQQADHSRGGQTGTEGDRRSHWDEHEQHADSRHPDKSAPSAFRRPSRLGIRA